MLGAKMLVEMGRAPQVTDWSIGTLVEHHLAASDYAATTVDQFRMAWALVPEVWRSTPVERVTVASIDGLYRVLAADGVSPHRVLKVHELLSVALQRAVRWQWLAGNPARAASRPKVDRVEVSPPATSDTRRALDLATGPLAAFLRVAAVVGARRGELVGLQWRDLTVTDRPRLIVRRSVAYTPASGVVVKDTKTGARGHRVVALDPGTMRTLDEHRAGRERDLEVAGAGWRDDWFVFSNDLGQSPWRPDHPTHLVAALRKMHGLPATVTIKNLRHYVATTMLAEGVAPTIVAGRLGHSTSTTTLRTYAHFVRSHDDVAADDLGAALD